MTTKPNNNNLVNALRHIGTAQSVKGQLMLPGKGYQAVDESEIAYARLGGRNIYHVSTNKPAFPLPRMSRRRGRYIGGLYYPYLVMGTPGAGGELNCYLQKAYNKFWVLWVNTVIDDRIFDRPVRQRFTPEPIAWCLAEKGDTRREAGLLLFHAMVLGLAYCKPGELYTNENLKYNRYTMYGLEDETHFIAASVFRSLHRSKDDLDRYAALCPPEYLEHFLHQAVIDPDAKHDDCFALDN